MAYNEQLNDRLREVLADHPDLVEKYMFGGVCYMVNGKMCIGVMKDELMCRVGPDAYDEALEQQGCHEMAFTGRVMKGYVLVSEDGIRTKKDLSYWLNACLKFNLVAKAAKKKKK